MLECETPSMAESGPEMRSTHVIFSLVEQPFYENLAEGVKIFLQNFKKIFIAEILAAEGLVAASPQSGVSPAKACGDRRVARENRMIAADSPKMFASSCVYTRRRSGRSRHGCLYSGKND
jgi:hypothetical protein